MRRASGLDRHWRRCRCSAEPCNRPHQLARHRRTASALGRSHFQPPARLRCGQASIAASRCCTTSGTRRPSPNSSAFCTTDPGCAMAHWGIAMSGFHQIWDRPDATTMATGWREIRLPRRIPPNRARAGIYCRARRFLSPGRSRFSAAHRCLRAAMGKLYARSSARCGCGSLLCTRAARAGAAHDPSLDQEHHAMAVLAPLWRKVPGSPGPRALHHPRL